VLAFATADPPPLPPAAESDGEGGERGGGGQQIDQYLDSIKQFVG
jgi:hypothetical protein